MQLLTHHPHNHPPQTTLHSNTHSARPETNEVSSLSVEPVDDLATGFICSLFDVPDFSVHDYVNREEEFGFCLAPFTELGSGERGKVCTCVYIHVCMCVSVG